MSQQLVNQPRDRRRCADLFTGMQMLPPTIRKPVGFISLLHRFYSIFYDDRIGIRLLDRVLLLPVALSNYYASQRRGIITKEIGILLLV